MIFLCVILTYVFGVGVSCRILYSIDRHFYVSCSGSITSVGEERANLSAILDLQLCGSSSEVSLFLLMLRMGYVILLWHSLSRPFIILEERN